MGTLPSEVQGPFFAMVKNFLMGLTASHANPLDSGQMMFHDVVWTFLSKLSRVLVISHYVELAHGCIGVINKIGVDRKQVVFMLQQLSIIMKIQSCVRIMIEWRLGLSQNCWFVRIVRVVPA